MLYFLLFLYLKQNEGINKTIIWTPQHAVFSSLLWSLIYFPHYFSLFSVVCLMLFTQKEQSEIWICVWGEGGGFVCAFVWWVSSTFLCSYTIVSTGHSANEPPAQLLWARRYSEHWFQTEMLEVSPLESMRSSGEMHGPVLEWKWLYRRSQQWLRWGVSLHFFKKTIPVVGGKSWWMNLLPVLQDWPGRKHNQVSYCNSILL